MNTEGIRYRRTRGTYGVGSAPHPLDELNTLKEHERADLHTQLAEQAERIRQLASANSLLERRNSNQRQTIDGLYFERQETYRHLNSLEQQLATANATIGAECQRYDELRAAARDVTRRLSDRLRQSEGSQQVAREALEDFRWALVSLLVYAGEDVARSAVSNEAANALRFCREGQGATAESFKHSAQLLHSLAEQHFTDEQSFDPEPETGGQIDGSESVGPSPFGPIRRSDQDEGGQDYVRKVHVVGYFEDTPAIDVTVLALTEDAVDEVNRIVREVISPVTEGTGDGELTLDDVVELTDEGHGQLTAAPDALKLYSRRTTVSTAQDVNGQLSSTITTETTEYTPDAPDTWA